MPEENEHEMKKSLTAGVVRVVRAVLAMHYHWEFRNGQDISFLMGIFGLFKKLLETCNISNRMIFPALVQKFKISEINNALFTIPYFPC